jgi:hypothetical protein
MHGFIHYYKIKVFVDNGMQRYETWKYVFAESTDKAIEAILKHYNSQLDTFAKVIEIYNYLVQDTMIFDNKL